MKNKKVTKREYVQPKLVTAQKAHSSSGVCGWYTQCGSQVKCRD